MNDYPKGLIQASVTRPERGGMRFAIANLWHGRRGRPTEADAPPISTFPGRKAKPITGQLDLDGRVHRPDTAPRMLGRNAR